MYLHTHFHELPMFVHVATTFHSDSHLRITFLEKESLDDQHYLKIEIYDAAEDVGGEPQQTIKWPFSNALDLMGIVEGVHSIVRTQLLREERGLAKASDQDRINKYYYARSKSPHNDNVKY